MKNKILLSILIIFFFSTSSVKSQITISPEIGISYLPFTLYPQFGGSFRNINSNEVNLLLGISAQMRLYEKWDAKLRISYTNRNDVEWIEYSNTTDPYFEWKHQDLNIDLNLRYNLYKNLSIGVGPSLIRSFMHLSEVDEERGFSRQFTANKFFFGLNAGISLDVKRININLLYIRTRRYKGGTVYRAPNGNNRLDFTIGYRIGKGRK